MPVASSAQLHLTKLSRLPQKSRAARFVRFKSRDFLKVPLNVGCDKAKHARDECKKRAALCDARPLLNRAASKALVSPKKC